MHLSPHVAGTRWIAAIHGVRIARSSDRAAVYDFDGANFSRFCERHGIPTGVLVQEQVYKLASAAYTTRVTVSGFDIAAEIAARAECEAEQARLIAAALAQQVAA